MKVSGSRLLRSAFVLGLLAASAFLVNAQKNAHFTPHEKAYYADPSVVVYVQPGLTINIVSAKVASDGTISVDYKARRPHRRPARFIRRLDARHHRPQLPGGLHSQGTGAIHLIHHAHRDRHHRRRHGHAGGRGFRRHQPDRRARRVPLHLPHQGARGVRSHRYPPHRHLRLAQSHRLGPGHELRRRDLRFRARRRHSRAPRHCPHRRLQRLPRPAQRHDHQHRVGGLCPPRRLAPRRATLHHVPPAADVRPQYRQYRST